MGPAVNFTDKSVLQIHHGKCQVGGTKTYI